MARIERVHEEFVDDYEAPDDLLEQIETYQKGLPSLARAVWLIPVIAVALIFFKLATSAQALAFVGFGYVLVAIIRCENRAIHATMLARKDIAGLRKDLAHARAQLTEIESMTKRCN